MKMVFEMDVLLDRNLVWILIRSLDVFQGQERGNDLERERDCRGA